MKQYKNVSPVDFTFCKAGATCELETDKDGLLATQEARERYAEGYLIELKIETPKIETKATKTDTKG